MKTLFAALYRFPFAAFMSGVVMSMGTNLLTATWPITAISIAKIVAAVAFLCAALSLAVVHSLFAKVNEDAEALFLASKGLTRKAELLPSLLQARRVTVTVWIAATVLMLAVGVYSSAGGPLPGMADAPQPSTPKEKSANPSLPRR